MRTSYHRVMAWVCAQIGITYFLVCRYCGDEIAIENLDNHAAFHARKGDVRR
jgi:hypothetical protein